VMAARISPDQKSIISVGDEGAIFIWTMPEDIPLLTHSNATTRLTHTNATAPTPANTAVLTDDMSKLTVGTSNGMHAQSASKKLSATDTKQQQAHSGAASKSAGAPRSTPTPAKRPSSKSASKVSTPAADGVARIPAVKTTKTTPPVVRKLSSARKR